MWIKKYISSLRWYNNDKWRIRAISKYFQSSEVFESVFSFMSLSTETIQFNKKWNGVTNLLQPFITYSPYGLYIFFLPLAPSPFLCGQKRNTEAIAWKYRWPAVKSLSWKVFAVSTPGCCLCSHQRAEVWPWPIRCGKVPFPLFARRSCSFCCACSRAQGRSGFCPPSPAHGDLDLYPMWAQGWDWLNWTEGKVCDSCQTKPALTARPFFAERWLQLFWEGVSPATALPPWHLPPSFAVAGRSSKHPDQQRADIPASGF